MADNQETESGFVEVLTQEQDSKDKPGLYYGGTFVSPIIPRLVKVISFCRVSEKLPQTKYLVRLIRPGAKDYGEKLLNNLKKIPYFDMFGCPEALISSRERQHHIEKLQNEASELKAEIVFEKDSGFLNASFNNVLIWGNEVIKAPNAPSVEVQNGGYSVRKKRELDENNMQSFLDKQLQLHLSFWPGVSELLFYISLHCITKLFLVKMGEDSGFLPLLVGPPGHLKTTLVKKYCLWTEDIRDQMITFQDFRKDSKLADVIEKYVGNNFLVDDYHAITMNYRKAKQVNRLDDYARMVTTGKNCAGIIVTGESVDDVESISCLDRILQIKIHGLESNELKKRKLGLQLLDRDFMPEVARYYVRSLMQNPESVEQDIRLFLEENRETVFDGTDVTLRISYHGMYVKLTEYLFRKYCCSNSKEKTQMVALYNALDQNRVWQEEELNQIREEKNHDYVLDLNEILNDSHSKYILVEVDSDKYTGDNPDEAFYKDGNFYLTKQAMQQCFVRYLKKMVNIENICQELKKNGLLVQSNSGKLYKRFAGKYHYVISRRLLKMYYKIKKENSTINVSDLLENP